mmetsp:Transcript_12991/g.48164  ORF Transcript_12991/g.48164 Transcript_12991/m.48164 type:complete len:211 (+) Transcript_12991:404-1036(+)
MSDVRDLRDGVARQVQLGELRATFQAADGREPIVLDVQPAQVDQRKQRVADGLDLVLPRPQLPQGHAVPNALQGADAIRSDVQLLQLLQAIQAFDLSQLVLCDVELPQVRQLGHRSHLSNEIEADVQDLQLRHVLQAGEHFDLIVVQLQVDQLPKVLQVAHVRDEVGAQREHAELRHDLQSVHGGDLALAHGAHHLDGLLCGVQGHDLTN